jgi:LysM repeat protein
MRKPEKFFIVMVLLIWVCSMIAAPITRAAAKNLDPSPQQQVSAYDLISAMNVLRMSYGNPPLIEDPIINAVAQGTAQIMADGLLSWHIGDVKGRLAAAGYGGGMTVFATENFAVGSEGITIDQIMLMWADYDHMRPATQAYYCHVGAGTAKASNGMTYFILQAAYISGQACESNYPVSGTPIPGQTPIVPGIVTPVELVEPDQDGNYMHTVKPGQSFWSIAVAYGVTIKEILLWNNLTDAYLLQTGDELLIAGPGSRSLATPTALGNVIRATQEADGRIVHEVQAYQNLSRISEAYGVSINDLLRLNGLTLDSPLQIGQSLIIKGPDYTPTPTEVPLSPLQKLTPAADGRYYHTVSEGENPQWIADLYGVPLNALLSWNGFSPTRVLYPGDRLLLQVTPPATNTPTPLPPTETPQPTATPSPRALSSATPPPTANSPSTGTSSYFPSPTVVSLSNNVSENQSSPIWLWSLAIAAVSIAVYFILKQSRNQGEKQ